MLKDSSEGGVSFVLHIPPQNPPRDFSPLPSPSLGEAREGLVLMDPTDRQLLPFNCGKYGLVYYQDRSLR